MKMVLTFQSSVDEIVGDGIPDNPGDVVWEKPVRTGEKISFNTNIGFSATLSFPLDGGLQERCKAAADTQIQLQQQLVANKRLDFELARLKNCGELMKDLEFAFILEVLMQKYVQM